MLSRHYFVDGAHHPTDNVLRHHIFNKLHYHLLDAFKWKIWNEREKNHHCRKNRQKDVESHRCGTISEITL